MRGESSLSAYLIRTRLAIIRKPKRPPQSVEPWIQMPTEGPSDFDRNADLSIGDSRIGLKARLPSSRSSLPPTWVSFTFERCLPGRNGMNWSRRRWSDGSSCLNI